MLAKIQGKGDVMNKGDMVKFKDPVDVHEEDERFVVLEDRGDRVLVGCLFTKSTFGETTALKTDDLTIAIPYEEGREKGLEESEKAEPFLKCSPYPAGAQERNDWSRGYHETLGQVEAGSTVRRV